MIHDYPELVAEAVQRTGLTSIPARAAQYMGMAEASLSKMLRVGEMEAEATLTTDADGVADLPTDYVTVRDVFLNKQRFHQVDLSEVWSNCRSGYAIAGGQLVSSKAERDHTLIYYAALPGLVENNTNWLLQTEPEIYLHAFMHQALVANMDAERVGPVAQYLGQLVEAFNQRDLLSRFGRARITQPEVMG